MLPAGAVCGCEPGIEKDILCNENEREKVQIDRDTVGACASEILEADKREKRV